MDIAARCITAALWLDHDLRRDTEIWFCFSNGQSVRVNGSVRSMNPDERCIAGFFRGLLAGSSYDGIRHADRDFEQVMQDYAGRSAYFLDINGQDIGEADIRPDPVFVLGDDTGMAVPPGAARISLGPKSYLSSHCITVLNNWMDRNAC
jgi:tRNA (pseudouridine54-N1)-methyltransferase